MLRRGRDTLRIAGLLAAAALALPAAAGAATFTVNDDTTGPGPAGADCANPDFSAPSTTPIQDAINAAAGVGDGINDTIFVCAGTYNEGVTVTNAGLDLLGAQAGVDARTRAVPASDESLVTGAGVATGGIGVAADFARIDGFDIEDTDGTVIPGLASGIAVDGTTSGHQLVNDILRSNSLGLYLNTAGANETTVRRNLFESNNDAGPGSGNAILSDNGTNNALVDENRFTGQTSSAMDLSITGSGSDVTVTDNDLVSNAGMLVSNTSNVTFEDNRASGNFGSAFVLDGDNGVTIQRNLVSGAVGGSAVRLFGAPSSSVSVLTNTFTGNAFGIRIDSGALAGELEAHFNRIAGNGTGANNNDPDVGDFLDAENNWWGCSEGPGQAGCDPIVGAAPTSVDADPWLILALSASPTSIAATGTSQITASVTRNSDNVTVGAGFPNATPIAFSATLGTVGSPRLTTNGTVTTTFTAAGQAGTGTVTAALDNEVTQTALSIGSPAAGAETVAKPKQCKKKKFREKHPKQCGKGKGKKAKKGKKRKRR